MQLSTLIEQLQSILDESGDMRVEIGVDNYQGFLCAAPVEIGVSLNPVDNTLYCSITD